MRAFRKTGLSVSWTQVDGTVVTKEIEVSTIDTRGLLLMAESLKAIDAPLPKIDSESIMNAARNKQDVTEVIVRMVADNLSAVYEWMVAIPQLLPLFLSGCTNLSSEQIDSLGGGTAMRVARQCWAECVKDGVFEEVLGFFGDLFRARSGGA